MASHNTEFRATNSGVQVGHNSGNITFETGGKPSRILIHNLEDLNPSNPFSLQWTQRRLKTDSAYSTYGVPLERTLATTKAGLNELKADYSEMPTFGS